MKCGVVLAGLLVATGLTVVCHAQCRMAPTLPEFRNLDFGEGAPGEHPPGWEPPAGCPQPADDPVTVEVISGDICYSGRHCVVARSGPVPVPAGGDEVIRYISLLRAPHVDHRGGIFQVVDLKPHRGQRMILRAAMRAQVPSGSEARLFLRIHNEDGVTIFFDNMGKFPVRSSAWHIYEIPASIEREANDVEFGMLLIGRGEAWIDHISVDFTGPEK